MNRSMLAGWAVVGLAPAALGQFSITPGGANAGNGVFSNGPIPAALNGSGVGGADFRATTTDSQDNMFQSAWWFRVESDTQEFTLPATGSLPGGPASTCTLVGSNDNTLDTGGYDCTVTNATAGYAFTAALRWHILAGPAGPSVEYSAAVTNASDAGLLAISLFKYDDIDPDGSFSHPWSWTGANYRVTSGGFEIAYAANAATARQAMDFSALRGMLVDAFVTNLDNTDGDGNGDFTAAFQWDVVIPSGESTTVGGSFGFVPEPSSLTLLALAAVASVRRRSTAGILPAT